MTYVFFSVLFFLGLAVGSFLNVATIRYSPEGNFFHFRNLLGRSHCMSCGKTLSPKELVPLFSFLFSRGKCASCGKRISLQYPIVEFCVGALFVSLPLFLNSFFGISNILFFSLASPAWYYLFVSFWVLVFLILIAIFVIDLKHYIIPNELNIILGIIGAILVILFSVYGTQVLPFRDSFFRNYALLFSQSESSLINHLIGFFSGGIFFLFLLLISRGRGIGMGDVKLAFVSGIVLGWPDIVLTTMIAFIFGGIWAATLFVLKKKTMKDKLPFGPFFVVAFALTIFFGFDIVRGYFLLFNL